MQRVWILYEYPVFESGENSEVALFKEWQFAVDAIKLRHNLRPPKNPKTIDHEGDCSIVEPGKYPGSHNDVDYVNVIARDRLNKRLSIVGKYKIVGIVVHDFSTLDQFKRGS